MTVKTSARRIICFALALGLVSLLGQCQPVPKPFASLNKGDFSTIQIGPRAGVIVLPITGDLPEGVAVNLAEAMAKALRRREVTASTGQGHSRSHYLWCEADLISRDRLQLSWRLTGSEHYETLTVTQTEEISSKAWLRGDDALLQSLAGKAADQVDRQLRRRERGQGRRIAFAPVTIGPVDGVPGQGGRKLAAAMQAALADAGVPLSDSPLDDGFILLGSMHVSPDGTDQRIEMVWHLIRPDGREFGTISQANTVPRAQVSGDWGNLASAIAKAGAPGVRDLLRRDPG